MKEKLFKKGITRRLFSVVLALAMVFTLMPIGSIQVHAAAESEYGQFINLLGSSTPATIEGLVEVSGPDADGYRTFKLLKDITADPADTARYSIAAGSSGSPRKIILDLNGHTIDRNLTSESGAGYNGFAFYVSNYINMIIDDSTASGTPGEGDYVAGKITGGAYSGIATSGDDCTLTLKNGKITGNYSSTSGGGIYANSGTLIIEGGEICNNMCNDDSEVIYGGGGIYTNAAFIMTGGAIYENKLTSSSERGGGIFIFGSKTYSITGGKIFNNECSCTSYGTAGAGIFANNNLLGSEIGGSVQVYDNKNTTKPDLPSNFYAYSYPYNIKIVPFTEEGRMGYSSGPTRGSVLQIAKEITLADLSHITSEYAISDNVFLAYCGGEDIHINLSGKNIANMKDHNTHTPGTLWASYHMHSYTYRKSGDSIGGYCFYSGCPDGSSEQNKITLELSAESKDYSATKTYAGAKIIDADGTEIKSDNVNRWTSAGLPVPSIKIYKVDTEGVTYGGTEVADLTGLEVGNYYASVTCGSDVTLKKAFKINVHEHNWVYTVGTGDDANELTATCTPEVGTCPDDKTATLTLTASSANYSGSEATITCTDTGDQWASIFGSLPPVKYSGGSIDGSTTTPPTAAGTYTASISAGEPAVTASVNFTIVDHNFNLATTTMTGMTFDAESVGADIAPLCTKIGYTPAEGDVVVIGAKTTYFRVAIYTGGSWLSSYTSEYNWSLAQIKEAISSGKTVHVIGTVQEPAPAPVINLYEEVPSVTGTVKDITNSGEALAETNPYSASIVNSNALETLVNVTPEEKAQGVNVWIEIVDASSTMPAADKTAIQNASGDYTVGMYLDVTLFKKVGSADPIKVSDVNGKVKISVVIPENLRKAGRTFEIIRVHNGVPTVIQGTYDAATYTFTFETDQFSSYAIGYKDISADTGNNNSVPATGDTNDVMYFFILMMLSFGAISFMMLKDKKKEA